MPPTRGQHSVRVGEATVTVIATAGPSAETWTLQIDGRAVAEQQIGREGGVLRGWLTDGTSVNAEIDYSVVGAIRVTVRNEGAVVSVVRGFGA